MKKASKNEVYDFADSVVVLGPGRSAIASAGGDAFWQALMSGRRPDVEEGWLISRATSEGAWATSEMHPEGEEIIVLLDGKATVVLERGGTVTEHALEHRGQLVIVPRGTWHYATSDRPVDLLFITAGKGTEHRPRG